jgi:capsular polysaccharide biosynthesis protein
MGSKTSIKQKLLSNTIRDSLTDKFKDKLNSIDKFIYINRSNNLAGSNRFIINNSDVINYVNKKFEIITFEQMSLEQKFLSTLNSTIVISPIGANLVNFFFSKSDTIKLFILLIPKGDKGFEDMNITQLIKLGNINPKIIKNLYCDVFINDVPSSLVNNPYIVNIDELDKIICQNYQNN